MERLREVVAQACRKTDCLYALMFGSQARGDAKVYSDLDMTVMFKSPGGCVDKAMGIAFDIEEEMGVRVDVVPLNVADTILRYEAYSQGELLYCLDKGRYLDDFINAIDEYLDFSYHFNKFYEKTLREMGCAVARGKGKD
ncbi:MAG: nucleotidyltransferase domain-containing protein [Candidatus Bathyarchaeia archaeon]